MSNTVDIELGPKDELEQLFPIVEGAPFTDQVAHAFNQSMERDHFFGAWADVYTNDGNLFRVRLTSPTGDLSRYEQTVPAYLAAGREALRRFNAFVTPSPGVAFLLPFGLAMSEYTSVMLLHYPPTEAFTFQDYIYTNTNRRWECCLAQNGFDGQRNGLVERMVDLVTLVAPGDDSSDIKPYDLTFYPYVKMQLDNFLGANAEHKRTAPLAVGGSPARQFIQSTCQDQLKGKKLEVGDVVVLEIVEGKETPVVCANHPSTFLFCLARGGTIQPGQEEEAVHLMRQDLICSGWQMLMERDWERDPMDALNEMTKAWADDDKVKAAVDLQVKEFAFYGLPQPGQPA